MSEKNLKVGQRVEITGKNVKGKVAYIGMTSFAVGKWVGVVLNEPKGKNNGSIKGQSYFTCPDNYGMFVRPTQLTIIGAGASSSEDITETATPTQPQPTRSRLSGSRQSLSSSRQSLLGSRSQLSTSLTEKSLSTSGSHSSGRKSLMNPPTSKALSAVAAAGASDIDPQSSKRASFVETGFLEILKPQFTPSQPMRSPSFTSITTNEDKITAAEQQKAVDDLKQQVADLTEKLETVKQRRVEDKDRLREFDKMKIQFEQLQEFKAKIMDAQALLQRDLQRAKQETKDAIEAREQHAHEMADLSDNVEMITLDKEMAEEKADTLQLELETARERIEELTLDLELIRAEMANKTDGGGGVGSDSVESKSSAYEIKQLEQQNSRLKETLVRLRDLSAHDKHDIQKLSKELDMKKSEVSELERTKEKLSSKIDELEAIIADLQEQVDAALGAEEMVEQLAEKKMELEDKVKLLQEEVAELEALEEIHEQLIESNGDLEMDLREELDLAHAAKKDVLREKEAALETIYDRDQTVMKFRELVQKLNDQIVSMREKTSNDDSLKGPSDNFTADAIDYKQMFAETKAYTRAIDVELRQIELTQANERVQMLTAYMPDSFMNRGGDNDAILVILLTSRIAFKCNIIVSQTRERFPAVEAINKETITQGHSVQQFAFKSRLLHYIHNLQCVMHQILYALNTCKPDTLLRAGSSLPEMIAQEKTIDSIIELLKLNQLDENSSTEAIEKCVSFFYAMNSVILAGEEILNETQMIRDCVAAISSGCDAILTDANTIRTIIKEGPETSNSQLLTQFVIENAESIKQQLKLIKRRLPQDLNVTKCGISTHTIDNIRNMTLVLNKIMSSLHIAAKEAVQTITTSGEEDGSSDQTIDHEKFWTILSSACERIYEQDDRGPMQFKAVLSASNIDLGQLAQYLLDKEYEIMSSANSKTVEKPVPPVLLRSQFIKKQLEQKNVLTVTLENREAEIKQLKLQGKLKQGELSEMQIRKDLAEKKLSVLQHDHDVTIEKLRSQYEETFELLKKKEKEFEDTMDHLQSDIEALETEKSSLREKLKTTGGSKRGDISSPTSAGGVISTTTYIAEEVHLLKNVFLSERNERLRLQANTIKEKLKKFEPIYVPKPKDKRLTELENQLAKMKHDWAISLMKTKTVNKPLEIGNNQRNDIELRAKSLASEILNEYLLRNPHRAATSDFSTFPTIEVKKVLKTLV